jgi:hypothetical protein
MGREPVSVNSIPCTTPVELCTGDKIEVHLEGRTRVFFFHGLDDTLQLGARPPLGQHNNATAAAPLGTQPALAACNRSHRAVPDCTTSHSSLLSITFCCSSGGQASSGRGCSHAAAAAAANACGGQAQGRAADAPFCQRC